MTGDTEARKWLGLIAIALGVSLVVVDTTIVNVITPSIIDDLGIGSSDAQWVQESYAIVFAAVLLLVGGSRTFSGQRLASVTDQRVRRLRHRHSRCRHPVLDP